MTLKTSIQQTLNSHQKAHSIPNSAAFPIILKADMPNAFSQFRCGDIRFRFSNFTSEKWALRSADYLPVRSDSPSQIAINISTLRIAGTYIIDAIPVPEIDFDLSGTLLPFERRSPRSAGESEGGPTFPPEVSNDYLDEARNQRQRLMDTKNGQAIMAVFDAHDEVYSALFETDETLRYYWKGNGATAEMSTDTYAAVKTDDSVINNSDKLYGNPDEGKTVTYNGNAFFQQNNIIASCIGSYGANWNFMTGEKMPDNKYTQAALAALNFQKIVDTTGNTSESTTEMTSSQVHETVNTSPNAIPTSELDELQNRMDQGMGAAGAPEVATQNGWKILSESERHEVRHLMIKNWEAAGKRQSIDPQVLWEGECNAQITDIQVTVTLDNTQCPQKITGIQVGLSSFDFELDDSSWTDPLGTTLRDRLSKIHFLRQYIAEQMTFLVEDTLNEVLPPLLNIGK